MGISAELLLMGIAASVLVGCQGQFKIIGLLNEEDDGANVSLTHQTNAQPRSLSAIAEAETAARESSQQNAIPKIEVIDQKNGAEGAATAPVSADELAAPDPVIKIHVMDQDAEANNTVQINEENKLEASTDSSSETTTSEVKVTPNVFAGPSVSESEFRFDEETKQETKFVCYFFINCRRKIPKIPSSAATPAQTLSGCNAQQHCRCGQHESLT